MMRAKFLDRFIIFVFFVSLISFLGPEIQAKDIDQQEEDIIFQIESYYNHGKKSLAEGDLLTAIVKFNHVIKLEKDFHVICTPYAKQYIQLAQDKIEEKELNEKKIIENVEIKKDIRQKENQGRTIKVLEYTLGQGDVLGIHVWQKVIKLKEFRDELTDKENTKGEPQTLEYTIGAADVLYIHIWQEESLSQEVIVRPDGKISFPLAGDVPAAGLSFNELKEELTQRLKEYIKHPMVSISLRKSRGKKVITFEEKLSQEVIVRPDGKISFPLAGDVPAAGLSFNELKEELTQRLKEYIKHPEVSISLKKLGGKKIIVLGEVGGPGIYAVEGKCTILEAIGRAGGFTLDAVPSSTILIRGGLENPKAQRINLSRAIKKADMSQNVVLQPEDIVYVPRKFIANVNYVLSQILGPISKGASGYRDIQDIKD